MVNDNRIFDDEFKKSLKKGLQTGTLIAAYITPILLAVTAVGLIGTLFSPKGGGSTTGK